MIDFKNTLRFLTKQSVNISIEEFLFLWIVRAHENVREIDMKEIKLYIDLYYAQNTFYGRDLEDTRNVKKMFLWNLVIEKLVAQKYLIDARTNKKLVDFKKLFVTDFFKKEIWIDSFEETWDRFFDLITERCGELQIGNSTGISYFTVNQRDPIINSIEGLKDYFWKKICQEGDAFCIEKFFHDLNSYLDNRKLEMKITNFLINYHTGTLEKEIQNMRNEAENRGSTFRRL